MSSIQPDIILFNGKITTLDATLPEVSGLAIKNGRVLKIGSDKEILALAKNSRALQIDLRRRRVIPGLNDSCLHLIRAGRDYNLELRWDGVPSLAYALDLLRKQVARTPPNHWVRVVGGWSELQFSERRMPTLKEINQIAPHTPVIIVHSDEQAL